MALIESSFDSVSLGRKNNIAVFVPDTGKDLYPAVYLQHGLGDDQKTPWGSTQLERYAAELELIVVTADAGSSWFCNDEASSRLWEDYFALELPGYIEKHFPASPKAESRGQCGFSMGGYGAMMLSLLHPERFSAVSVHSGSFIFGHEYREDRPERAEYMAAVAPPGGRYDLFALCERYSETRSTLPAIRFDVGRSDRLLEQNRRFHSCLEENNIIHDYIENKGFHSWAYVEKNLYKSLVFLKSELKV